jgi:glutathione S-transferase
MPFGQVPVLSVDGKLLAQSYAIYRYLAREFVLAGKNSWEQAQCDAVADVTSDVYEAHKKWR